MTRRRIRYLSAPGTWLLSAPSVLLSALLLFTVAVVFGPWVCGAVAALWLYLSYLSVHSLWFAPDRAAIAVSAFGFRRPAGRETEVLAAAWANVTRAPGLDGWPYALWVEQSERLNAYAAPTRIVAVTSWAIDRNRPRRLEALLAHELGHHLLVDPRIRLLGACATLPGQLLWRLGEWLGRLLNFLGRAALPARFVLAVTVLVLLVLAVRPAMGPAGTSLLAVLLVVEPLTRAARSRREEFAADRVAVDIGYGRPLAAALRSWAQEHPPLTGLHGVRDRLFSTHPATQARVRAINAQLQERARRRVT